MSIKIQVNKTDNKSTVVTTNMSVFDAPVVREREFDHDELEGVIDDWDNPYDLTIPVTVSIMREAVVSFSKNRLK